MARRDPGGRGYLDVADLTEPELRQEILTLRRRVQKLAALLRLVLALLQASGFTLARERRRQVDELQCPRTTPHQLTAAAVRAIGAIVTSPEYRHVPTGTLAVLAPRLGISVSDNRQLVRRIALAVRVLGQYPTRAILSGPADLTLSTYRLLVVVGRFPW